MSGTVTVDGLRVLQSQNGPQETLDRLVAAITKQGMTIIARIDHGALAEKVGVDLRPTVLVLFGDPRAGAPAINAAQTLGIDLPLKVLIWQDEKGVTWLGYNEPGWMARRHAIVDDGTVDVMTDVIEAIAGEAVGR